MAVEYLHRCWSSRRGDIAPVDQAADFRGLGQARQLVELATSDDLDLELDAERFLQSVSKLVRKRRLGDTCVDGLRQHGHLVAAVGLALHDADVLAVAARLLR